MVVPLGCARGLTSIVMSLPSHMATMPLLGLSVAFDVSSRRDTEAIEARASPRNPSVATASRSSIEAILLVA